MKRRTLLLLTTMAMAMVMASGVALAKAITCPTGSNGQCVGTFGADVITGTDNTDTIDGKFGADTINALGSPDTINGGGGADTIDGGTGDDVIRDDTGNFARDNDTLKGGEGANELYGRGGNDTFDSGPGSALQDDIMIDLVARGNELYKFPAGFGIDGIQDAGGTDIADLSSYSSQDIDTIFNFDVDGNGVNESVGISLEPGTGLTINFYFDNNSASSCAPGSGKIEALRFSDGDFQLIRGGCSTSTASAQATTEESSVGTLEVEDKSSAPADGAEDLKAAAKETSGLAEKLKTKKG